MEGIPNAKAIFWYTPDTEVRKRGERTGLDTLVVRALNDADSFLEDKKTGASLKSDAPTPCFGQERKPLFFGSGEGVYEVSNEIVQFGRTSDS